MRFVRNRFSLGHKYEGRTLARFTDPKRTRNLEFFALLQNKFFRAVFTLKWELAQLGTDDRDFSTETNHVLRKFNTLSNEGKIIEAKTELTSLHFSVQLLKSLFVMFAFASR